MAIEKKPYEISIWSEILGENGQKIEHKDFIIGAHDMEYAGRATSIKFEKKLNGTHTLTFSMPDKWYDHKLGEYVQNEFIDQLYNERKVKFFYKSKWYEFYIKQISDAKNFKSYMKTFTCNDAFIDELSRNGYGLTFDEELYNNVEEVGTFTEEILEDSVWYYAPQNNWGDFTEFLEEKLFKIPVSQFESLQGYKLNYSVENSNSQIINAYTNEKRDIEMGDDLARHEGRFWDQRGENGEILNPLIGIAPAQIENDGYIYVPYSQLNFCYKTTSTEGEAVLTSTEEPCFYQLNNEQKSYALAPATIDPSALIQFIAIPKDAVVEIDEAGTIVNKDYTYVMTVEQWNSALKQNKNFYQFEPFKQIQDVNGTPIRRKVKKYLVGDQDLVNLDLTGNYAAYYEGYLDSIGDIEVLKGKKISISDRTEINPTEEIDQYVKVYNNSIFDEVDNNIYYSDILNDNPDWSPAQGIDYKICSKIATRQIVPQLARNMAQNSVNIRSTDGWEVVKLSDTKDKSSTLIKFIRNTDKENGQIKNNGILQLTKSNYNDGRDVDKWSGEAGITGILNPEKYGTHDYNTVINFGLVGQGISLSKDKIYVLGFKGKLSNNDAIVIGEGSVISSGDYKIFWEHQNLNYDGNYYSIYSLFNGDNETVKKDTETNEGFIFIQPKKDFINPYIGIWLRDNNYEEQREIEELWFFEAFTKGIDQFPEDECSFKYSGREMSSEVADIMDSNYTENNGESFYKNNGSVDKLAHSYSKEQMKKLVLFETDIMPGDTYEYQQYFIQQVVAGDNCADTFGQKVFLSEKSQPDAQLPYSAQDYTEDEISFNTKYFNLNKCPYYNSIANLDQPDCKKCNGICLYQKYGYCPYLFQTEKHCRKIRTLKKDKSNRFNLTQELSKVFEIYPMYFTNNDSQGRIVKRTEIIDNEPIEVMDKRVFYITEKGKENKLGFRYEKNLSNISRTLKSDQIVTKLYVQDVDSDISNTGLCTIKTAEDNPSKDSFIIDFSYYVAKGLISVEQVERDLYGIEEGDMAYLKQLGYYNTEYDKLSNLIINLQSESYTELEANIEANFEGIIAAKQQMIKYKKQIDKYGLDSSIQTVQNTITKLEEQVAILNNLYEELFNPQNETLLKKVEVIKIEELDLSVYEFVGSRNIRSENMQLTIENYRETEEYKNHLYESGMLGQFNREYRQIQEWKKLQAVYLKKINELSLRFFKKYEPYIKEGTWTDSNYLTDNAYYFGALEVAAEGAIPKVSYTITTVDLSTKPEYEDDYQFDIADTTYVEDIGMFGVNQKTGLPNKLKVLISGITEDPDVPTSNSITVQNFTTQFEDLFKQVSVSVQSLTYNENIYKRSSNFTSNQNVKEDSLQGTLDSNNLTLINTQENNIELDAQGQSGSDINNHSNKYKLNGQGLFFSNNGGQTWNVGVGPGGINADYIKVGSLDAGKIKIVDNDFLYFYWDKDGIVALKEPSKDTQTSTFNSYAMFNRYGLSLVENGKIKLRAGYEFNSAGKGEIKTEISQSNHLGFYLYDNSGYPIFRTESTESTDIRDKKTARLSLRGEMFVTDGFLADSLQGDFYVLSVSCYTQNVHFGQPCQKPNNFESQYANFGAVLRCYFYTSDGYKYHVSRSDSERFQSIANKNLYLIHYKGMNNDKDEWFSIDTTKQTEQIYLIADYGASVVTDISNEGKLKDITENNVLVFDGADGHFYGQSIYKYGQTYATVKAVKDTEDSNTIGLYLNNKMENGSASEQDGYIKRILSCIKEENGNLNNILSILQNGSLYIGGTVDPQDNNERTISELSDLIKINNAGIELIKENGQYQIRMDFANFKDAEGKNLASSISGTQENIDKVEKNLMDEINNIKSWINTMASYLNADGTLSQWNGI